MPENKTLIDASKYPAGQADRTARPTGYAAKKFREGSLAERNRGNDGTTPLVQDAGLPQTGYRSQPRGY
jgi:hypothetical protein